MAQLVEHGARNLVDVAQLVEHGARNLVVVGLSPIQEGSSVVSFQSIALTYSNMPDMLLRNATCMCRMLCAACMCKMLW